MTKLYSYKNKIGSLTADQLVAIILAGEKQVRTDKFKYIEQQAFNSQVEEIKTSWPDNYKEAIRNKAREIAGQGNPITPTIIRKAIVAFGEILAIDRAKASGKQLDSERRYISAEIALATLFRRAPDAGLAALFSKKYQDSGKTMRVKPAVAPKNLVVNITEASGPDSPDIYILAVYVEELQGAILLGHATKEDIAKAKSENSAFHIPLAQLRPMSTLYTEAGLTEIPGGISYESVPTIQQIPIPVPGLTDMKKGQTKDEFDFLASVGLASVPAKPAPSAPAAPATSSMADL